MNTHEGAVVFLLQHCRKVEHPQWRPWVPLPCEATRERGRGLIRCTARSRAVTIRCIIQQRL